jgi:hypothetical protein
MTSVSKVIPALSDCSPSNFATAPGDDIADSQPRYNPGQSDSIPPQAQAFGNRLKLADPLHIDLLIIILPQENPASKFWTNFILGQVIKFALFSQLSG